MHGGPKALWQQSQDCTQVDGAMVESSHSTRKIHWQLSWLILHTPQNKPACSDASRRATRCVTVERAQNKSASTCSMWGCTCHVRAHSNEPTKHMNQSSKQPTHTPPNHPTNTPTNQVTNQYINQLHEPNNQTNKQSGTNSPMTTANLSFNPPTNQWYSRSNTCIKY